MERHRKDPLTTFAEAGSRESSLLPMLLGGLVLIIIGGGIIMTFV